MKGVRRSLTVEGLNLERLIRQAGEAGISLARLKRRGRRMTALVAEDQLPALQEMAQKGGWSLTCGRRHGRRISCPPCRKWHRRTRAFGWAQYLSARR